MKKEINIEDTGKISGGMDENKDVKKWEKIMDSIKIKPLFPKKIPLNCIGGKCYAMEDENGKMVEYHFHSKF